MPAASTAPSSAPTPAGSTASTFGVSRHGQLLTRPRPRRVMVDAIADVIGWKLGLAGVHPRARTALTSAGRRHRPVRGRARSVTLPTVLGHRDVGSTACPGTNLYAALPAVRSRALSQIARRTSCAPCTPTCSARVPGDSEVAYWVPRVSEPNGSAIVAGGFSGSEEYRKRVHPRRLRRRPRPRARTRRASSTGTRRSSAAARTSTACGPSSWPARSSTSSPAAPRTAGSRCSSPVRSSGSRPPRTSRSGARAAHPGP